MPLFKISLSSTKRIWLICPKGRIGLKDCLISVIRLVRPQSRTKINVFLCDLMAIKASWRQMIQHFDSGGLHMSISEIIAVSLQYLLYMIHGILLILLVFAPEVLRWSHRFGLCSRLKFTALCICLAPFTFSSTYYDTTGQKYEGGYYYYYCAVAPEWRGLGFD